MTKENGSRQRMKENTHNETAGARNDNQHLAIAAQILQGLLASGSYTERGKDSRGVTTIKVEDTDAVSHAIRLANWLIKYWPLFGRAEPGQEWQRLLPLLKTETPSLFSDQAS
jgi:hypothetical protein